jgi:hypothetical protein
MQLLQKSINQDNFLLSPPRIAHQMPTKEDAWPQVEACLSLIPEGYLVKSQPNGILPDIDISEEEDRIEPEGILQKHLAVIEESPAKLSSAQSQNEGIGSLNLSKISATKEFNSKSSEDQEVRQISKSESPSAAATELEKEFQQFARPAFRKDTVDSEYFIRRQASMQNRFNDDDGNDPGMQEARRKIELEQHVAIPQHNLRESKLVKESMENPQEDDNILSNYLKKSPVSSIQPQIQITSGRQSSGRNEQIEDDENGLSQVVDFFGMNQLQEASLFKKNQGLSKQPHQPAFQDNSDRQFDDVVLGFRREDLGSQRLLNTSMGSETSFGKPKENFGVRADPDYEYRNYTSRDEDNLAVYLRKQQNHQYGKNIFTEYTSRDLESAGPNPNTHHSFYQQQVSMQNQCQTDRAKSDPRAGTVSQSVSIEVDEYLEVVNPNQSSTSQNNRNQMTGQNNNKQSLSRTNSQDASHRIHESSFSYNQPQQAIDYCRTELGEDQAGVPNFTKKSALPVEVNGSARSDKNSVNRSTGSATQNNNQQVEKNLKKNPKQDEVDWQALVEDIQRSESSMAHQSFQQEESLQEIQPPHPSKRSHHYPPGPPSRVHSEQLFVTPIADSGIKYINGKSSQPQQSSYTEPVQHKLHGLKTASLPDDHQQQLDLQQFNRKKKFVPSQQAGTSNMLSSMASGTSSQKQLIAQPAHDLSLDSFGQNKENSNPFAMNSLAGGSIHSAQTVIGSGSINDRARLIIKLKEETNFLKNFTLIKRHKSK